MAWIESHQELGSHPKTLKLARILGVSRAAAVGHLHFLWWWALDYSQEGNLNRFEALDIAIGGEWESDPETFVDALVRAGFLDQTSDGLAVHDWDQYGGRLQERRAKDAERKRTTRNVQRMSSGQGADIQETACVTQHNSREHNKDASASARKTTRATATPNEYTPNETQYAWARDELGFDTLRVDRETEKFLDHHRARGSTMKSWDAAWRNWMRRVTDYAPRGKGGAPTQSVDGKPYWDGTQYRRADGLVV